MKKNKKDKGSKKSKGFKKSKGSKKGKHTERWESDDELKPSSAPWDESDDELKPSSAPWDESDDELSRIETAWEEPDDDIKLSDNSWKNDPMTIAPFAVVFLASVVLGGCLTPAIYALALPILVGAHWWAREPARKTRVNPRKDMIGDVFDREGAARRRGVMYMSALITGLVTLLFLVMGAFPWLGAGSLEEAYETIVVFGILSIVLGLATAVFWEEYRSESSRIKAPRLLPSVERFILESAVEHGSMTAGTLALNSRLDLKQASTALGHLEEQGYLHSEVVGDGALQYSFVELPRPSPSRAWRGGAK
ncbi:hypothetical protein DL240_09100 [Lujinxingia litoralis]|uniref:Uncharacterized protein n=1 Tax=Lujinxingia litoralis TaxID=2211119 RepID=A0A328CB83_9DELT|nr:hypothetical protein [Lujinxingia litoralis]RAL23033.1 hypothetical protein DL240_09100 [Lujinxingia litoralis]